jgi:RNA polymerase sigma factor (sigma-70 family)
MQARVSQMSSYPTPEAVCRAHQARLLRLLTVASPDPETAADVLQEAFARLFLNWETVSQHPNQPAWVMRVALNLLSNRRRSYRRKVAALVRLGQAEFRSEPFETCEERLDLVRAIRGLPPRRRLILALHYLEGLPVTEIAECLHVSPGTVTKQLHRARTTLREQLGEG